MDRSRMMAATNGGTIQITLLWQGEGKLPELRLLSDDGKWQAVVVSTIGAHDTFTTDWREAHVPAEAQTGMARLVLPDGTLLARYSITSSPGLFAEPPVQVRVNGRLPPVGELYGFSIAGSSLNRSEPISLTLVWHTGLTPPLTSYTAFVQLIGVDSQVLAQSDAIPGQGQRPTTSWRPGEYIVDHHQLTFHPDVIAGQAKLIAGMYDSATGARVSFDNGSDFVPLPLTVDVH
jgi:hypothetical protein